MKPAITQISKLLVYVVIYSYAFSFWECLLRNFVILLVDRNHPPFTFFLTEYVS